jgi:hypothetical protein
MRILIAAAWLLLLPVAFAYHLGPGQVQETLDATAAKLAEADRLTADQRFAEAVDFYDEALRLLPDERKSESRRIRVERAKAMMLAKKLPEAHADLKVLVEELQEDPKADPKVLAEARSVMANSQYYITWLMRLEGLGRDAWEPEIESARQTYKLLAEQAEREGDQAAARAHEEDLESAIRLARVDLSELQGLPLPSQ